jgi:hypothetical protein
MLLHFLDSGNRSAERVFSCCRPVAYFLECSFGAARECLEPR